MADVSLDEVVRYTDTFGDGFRTGTSYLACVSVAYKEGPRPPI